MYFPLGLKVSAAIRFLISLGSVMVSILGDLSSNSSQVRYVCLRISTIVKGMYLSLPSSRQLWVN